MSINDLAAQSGVYMPEDLVFLTSVFDEVKWSQKTFEPWQHNALARQILYIHGTGVGDRELIAAVISHYKKPRLVRFGR